MDDSKNKCPKGQVWCPITKKCIPEEQQKSQGKGRGMARGKGKGPLGFPTKEEIFMSVDMLVDEILLGDYDTYKKVNEAIDAVDQLLNMIQEDIKVVSEKVSDISLFEKDLTNPAMKKKMRSLAAKCKGIQDEKQRQKCLRGVMMKVHKEWKIERVLQTAKTPLEEKMVASVKLLISEEDYKTFFKSMMKKWNINSPSELSDDKKKEFFDVVDKEWKAKKESD